MSPIWNRGQPGQVSARPLSHRHVSGDDGEPLFEGFPLSGEGFDPSITARRIFILQAAKCLCLAELARSSVVSLSSGPRESSLYVVASARTSPPVGFRGRVRCDFWTPSNESDLLWWLKPNHLLQGVSLEV